MWTAIQDAGDAQALWPLIAQHALLDYIYTHQTQAVLHATSMECINQELLALTVIQTARDVLA